MKVLLLLFFCFLVAFASAFVPLQQQPTRTTALNMDFIMNPLKAGKFALVKSLAGEYDQAAVRARLENLIKDNNVLMLSFTTCPYCLRAKEILKQVGLDKLTVVELDVDPDGKAIRAEMIQVVQRTSVPAIWIGQEFVGGCNDGPMGGGVSKLYETGQLQQMLKNVNAI